MPSSRLAQVYKASKLVSTGFGESLNIRSGVILQNHCAVQQNIDVSLEVSASLCHQNNFAAFLPGRTLNETKIQKVAPELGLSTVLALFDEVSTLGLAIKDRQHRPGQSLGMEIMALPSLKTVRPGDKVVVSTRASKIGKSVAFCDIELYREHGSEKTAILEKEILARGRQTKYLEMGSAFHLATQPLLLSTTRWLAERYFKGNPYKRDEKNPSCVAKGGGEDVVGAVWKGLGFSVDEEIQIPGPPLLDNVRTFQGVVDVSVANCNPLGNFHGGAAICAVEMAVSLAQEEWSKSISSSKSTIPYKIDKIMYISANYYRPSRGKVGVLVSRTEGAACIDVSFVPLKSKNGEPSCKVVCVMH
eukprot:CFRG2198T1